MVTCNEITVPEDLFPEKLTICLLQLRSPFFGEANVIRGAEYPILGWLDSAHNERRRRIQNCFDCVKHFERHINLLVLPEYSISKEMLDLVGDFSQESTTVVIGTFYDVENRMARTFAVIPAQTDCNIEMGCKLRRSHHDVNVLRELGEQEKSLLRLAWSAHGENKSLLVLSCIDFLQWPDLEEDIKDTDILVSPMSSSNIDLFKSTAWSAIRWVRPNATRTRSRICILCNAVDIAEGGLGEDND